MSETPDDRSTWTHPAAATRFPPADESFAGDLMLKVARGLEDREDLQDQITDLIESDEFAEVFPDDDEPSLDEALALLDEVIAEHDRVVTATSEHVATWFEALEELEERGVAFSFGQGFDTGEAAQDGFEEASELEGAIGYGYSHLQDLDRLVLTGTLVVGFSGMSGRLDEEAATVARTIVEVVTNLGLPVTWSGDPGTRIEVGPLAWEVRAEED
ncbi:MAG TPA: hypothetical protein VGE77_00155 [Nocardioides sp.]